MLDVKSQDISIPEAVVVLCTAPDEATAQDLAAKVLAEKLAACATLLPGATSLYYWEGKLEQEYEVQMILKTTVSHQQALIDCLKSHHPYQTPELLVLPVMWGGNYFCTDRRCYKLIVKSTTTRPMGDLGILHCAEKNDLKMIFLP